MSIKRVILIECDYGGCDDRFEYEGPGGSTAAMEQADKAGWRKRTIWHLCPGHADVKAIVRPAFVD